MAKTVIGTFETRQSAEQAIAAMRSKGFAENEISIVARQQSGQEQGRQGQQGNQPQDRGNMSPPSQQDQGTMQMPGEDIGDGVGWGAGLGAGAGLLATAGALTIPGIGPLLAIGPLAATLSGAVTGGIAGGLVDWGVPEEDGRRFEGRVREGKVLCVVRSEDRKTDQAAQIMRQHGAKDVETHQASA